MIKEFVERWESRKGMLRAMIAKDPPDSYGTLVRQVVEILQEEEYTYGDESPDPERVHTIDDGDYQGTLLFVIGAKGYQPEHYWYVKVDYGSCSGCDTLQGISGYSDDPPDEQQVKDYMTLALHIVQGLKVME